MKKTAIFIIALLFILFILNNTWRSRREERRQIMVLETQREAGYQEGLAAGINAAMATIHIKGTGMVIDLADTLEHARTNKAQRH
jgi:hypothetical protein